MKLIYDIVISNLNTELMCLIPFIGSNRVKQNQNQFSKFCFKSIPGLARENSRESVLANKSLISCPSSLTFQSVFQEYQRTPPKKKQVRRGHFS